MGRSDDFWESLLAGQFPDQDVFGDFLQSRQANGGKYFSKDREIGGDYFSQVADLTDKYKEAKALHENPEAGTKVRFVANIGSVLAYDDIPEPDAIGTVVAVRSASGDITEQDGRVFTLWPDGKVRAISALHLRFVAPPENQTEISRRVASLGDLDDFIKIADDTLVHKATKDLWALRQVDGEYVIERLFSDDGHPLKV